MFLFSFRLIDDLYGSGHCELSLFMTILILFKVEI